MGEENFLDPANDPDNFTSQLLSRRFTLIVWRKYHVVTVFP